MVEGGSPERTLLVDLSAGTVQRMRELTLASLRMKERDDLQRWVSDHPDLVEPNLLLVTTEFDKWQIGGRRVDDRLDMLFIDRDGSPLVAELKRDRAADTVDSQALKYAAYCSQLTLDDLVEEFASYHRCDLDDARQRILDHAQRLELVGLGRVRVRLVAGSFGPAVTSVVLWLRDYELDIGCIEVTVREVPGTGHAVLSSRQLLPLAEAEEFMVRRRRKEREEEKTRLNPPRDWTWEDYTAVVPAAQLDVAQAVHRQIDEYVKKHSVPWTAVFRQHHFAYQRPGGYIVVSVIFRRSLPIIFAVKLPTHPDQLGLIDPYPELQGQWNERYRQWGWEIPTVGDLPNLEIATDMSRGFQPVGGPMPLPGDPAGAQR